MTKLKLSLESGVQLIQFREPKLKEQISHDQLFNIFKDVLSECHKYDAACLINSCHAQSWWAIADGIHFAAQDATSINFDAIREQRLPGSRRGNYFVAVSTHNLEQIQAAQEIGADFVVLGHVLNTTSHPNQKPMGWENFNKIRAQAKMPVFAIGGQSKETYSTALENGAHGIAAIRGLPIT